MNMLSKSEKRELICKFLKQFKKSPCLWSTKNQFYYNQNAKDKARAVLLKIWNRYEPVDIHGLKNKIQGFRSMYRRERRKVESSDFHYEPKLWYYKHLNFLSGEGDTDVSDSDSDEDDDTEQLLHGQKRSIDHDGPGQEDDPMPSVDASAAAFGRSVGAQLHHLSKMQRCIAEKLISDVIYHGKMEELTLNTSIKLRQPVEDQDHDTILIPKAGPSWYDTGLENGEQESSSSHPIPIETEDLTRREIEETQNAVNFIKMESPETETYVFHDNDLPEHTTIDIVKEELM